MKKYISLGKYNKNYKYILLYLISRGINDCIYSLNYKDLYKEIYFFGEEAKEFFNNHQIVNTIFCYLGIFFFSLILIKYDSFIQNNKHNNETPKLNKSRSNLENSSQLIYNLPEDFLNYNKNRINLDIFLVAFLWVIIDLLDTIMSIDVNDFWTFRMVFVYFFGKKIFNIQIYRHQIFAIYFISIVCSLLLLISYFYSKEENEDKHANNIYFISFGILIYLLNLLIDAYSDWKAKRIIDLKFISSSKLFFCYGILGFLIYSIICIITTIADFEIDDNQNLFKFDNFIEYFDYFNKKNLILMVLYVITFALKSLFYLLTIEHLTPFHVICMPTFYLFFIHIILGINTIIRDKDMFHENLVKILLEVIACFFGIIAFSIFLEFIELNFCSCNYNLKRYIVQRSNKELNNDNEDDSLVSEEDKKEEEVFENELPIINP